jgi:lipid-binding SYLF domain-containing protein
MLRTLPSRLAWAFGILLAAFPVLAHAQSEQQALVDRATLTVQEIVSDLNGRDVINLLQRSRGVMICPRLFKAGFIFGGQGGSCVLLARDGAGSWSDPAFYNLGSGSVGFQIGIQDSEMLMVILTQRGLSAVMDSQFKLGADASIAFATVGAGIEGATTAAVGADIVAFAKTRGLFAGASLSGTGLSTNTDWNQAYYGQALAARQIVVQMQANNPGADPLRAVLTRFGAAAAAPRLPPPVAPMQDQDQEQGPPYGSGPTPLATGGSGRVQSAPLPPPR